MTTEHGTCPETGRTLLLVAGELPASQEVAAREHLESCPACRAVARAVREVEEEYAGARVSPLGEDEVGEILRRATTRSPVEKTGSVRSRKARRLPARGAWLAAAAAAVTVLAGGVVFGLRREVEVASTSPLERLAAVEEAGTRGDARTLLDLLEGEPNPNVRLAILDALARTADPGDPRLLDVLETEPMAPLRIDILDLAAREGIAGVREAAERLAREDGAATVRARAALILSEL